MEKICEPKKCFGCGACAGVCPRECIVLKADMKDCGVTHPVIDQSRCINCGKCVRVCPANVEPELREPSTCYASVLKDQDAFNRSASGGLGWVIARSIIMTGGVAYGSALIYPEKGGVEVRHIRVEDVAELTRLQGSKYVQSSVPREVYLRVLEDLKAERKVAFFGTGCQTAAIKRFVGERWGSRLLTVDIICHGVPSQKVLNDYLGDKHITDLSFRQKTHFNFIYTNPDGTTESIPMKSCSYMQGFLKASFYRDSCYSCPFAKQERVTDITIGDYWGLRKKMAMNGKALKSVSLALINTDRGAEVYADCLTDLLSEERPLEEAVAGNSQLREPSSESMAKRLFRALYPRLGYRRAATLSLVRPRLFYRYYLPLRKFARKYPLGRRLFK